MELYRKALEIWKGSRDLDQIEAILNPLQSPRDMPQARILELKAWVRAARGDYAGQLNLLDEAWQHALRSGDQPTCASILHAWSLLIRDLYPTVSPSWDPNIVTEFDWAEFQQQQFQAYRALAYIAWLQGELAAALKRFRQARLVCPSKAWMVTFYLDLSLLSEGQGELAHTQYYIEQAAEIAEIVEWDTTVGEERLALLTLARYPLYTTAYDKYTQLTTPLDSSLGAAKLDRRVLARETDAKGRALLALGETTDGIDCITQAYRTWIDVGCKWRAAICDVDIAKASGLAPGYALSLRETVSSPWLDQMVKPYSVSKPAIYSKLTPAERDVLQAMLHGASNKEIGAELYNSPHTVRNHIASMCKKLGVTSRTEMISLVLRSGSS